MSIKNILRNLTGRNPTNSGDADSQDLQAEMTADTVENPSFENPNVLISCHLARTGGTSLRQMLIPVHRERQVFLSRLTGLLPVPRKDFALMRQRYFFARSIDGQDLRYVDPESFWPSAKFITVVREPVSLLTSYYSYLRWTTGQQTGLPEPDVWLDQNFPGFVDFARVLQNYMTRYYAWGTFDDTADDDTLATAKAEIKKYHYLAMTDHLAEVPSMLGHDFPELTGQEMPRVNVNTAKFIGADLKAHLSPADVDRVRGYLSLDLRFYDYVKELRQQRGLAT